MKSHSIDQALKSPTPIELSTANGGRVMVHGDVFEQGRSDITSFGQNEMTDIVEQLLAHADCNSVVVHALTDLDTPDDLPQARTSMIQPDQQLDVLLQSLPRHTHLYVKNIYKSVVLSKASSTPIAHVAVRYVCV